MSSKTLVINGKLNQYGFCVKKSNFNKDVINTLKEKFVAIPTGFEDTEKEKEKKKFCVFYEDAKYLVLPKFCYKLEFEPDKKISFNNKKYNKIKFSIDKITYKNTKCNIETTRKPYDYQELILDHLLNYFKECDKNKLPKGGIIQLDCGGGKTVLAECLACLLNVKTLIIVPQQPILEQWIDEFKDFSNARIGLIQGPKADVKDKDVVIAMVQSLSLKDYDLSIFEGFGLVIYDEVHHLGARKFSKALQKTSFEDTIGLSATPDRADDTTFVINWNIGEILYSMQRELDYKIWIKRINFTSSNALYKVKNRWFKGRIAANTASTRKNLLSLTSRNNLVCSVIMKLILLNRKILILSETLEHLSKLCLCVDNELSKLRNKGVIKEDEYKTHVYIGSTKKDSRKFIKQNGNIIFATIQLVEEGFDVKRLNTVVFASPVSIPTDKETKQLKTAKKLIQSIGRILRKNELDSISDVPIVIDFADDLGFYKTWGKRRDIIYRKKKWFVQDYHFKDCEQIENLDSDSDSETKSNLSKSSNSSKSSKNILKNDKKIFFDIEDEEFIHKNLIIKKDKQGNIEDEFNINDCVEHEKQIKREIEDKSFNF